MTALTACSPGISSPFPEGHKLLEEGFCEYIIPLLRFPGPCETQSASQRAELMGGGDTTEERWQIIESPCCWLFVLPYPLIP